VGIQRSPIGNVYVHPKYDFKTINYDVAILEITGKFRGPYIDYKYASKINLTSFDPLEILGYG